jgi:hypothetical protein
MRIATPEDVSRIEDLLREMHTEIGVGRLDEDKARGAILPLIQSRQCIVATRGDEIVGSVGLTLTSFWYSKDTFLTDMWFFVHPDHRNDKNEKGENGGHATKLIAAAKKVADLRKVPLVLQVGSSKGAVPKFKFFAKHMTPFGGAFVHFPRAA